MILVQFLTVSKILFFVVDLCGLSAKLLEMIGQNYSLD